MQRGKSRQPAATDATRSGRVAIVGRPNVGKSTFLNAALGVPLAIVSKTPQTTRESLLGVVKHALPSGEIAELCLVDTPGLHRGERALDRFMNREARGEAEAADVVLFLTDVPRSHRVAAPHPGDLTLLADIGAGAPTVLAINKVDRIKAKADLLPLLAAFQEASSRLRARPFDAVVPISALRSDGVDRVLTEVGALLPEAPHRFSDDDLTDRPTRFFAREYVREQVLLLTREEVPHATAVTVEAYEERPKSVHVSATIHVDRPGQKRILVGSGGAMLKQIGTAARKRLEELVGAKIYLELFVRVTEGWRDAPAQLVELGYGGARPGARKASS